MEKQRKTKQKKKNSPLCRVFKPNTRQRSLHRSAAQSLCRVLKYWHSAKIRTFAECHCLDTRQTRHVELPWRGDFAECPSRISAKFQTLPSVRLGHSAKSPRQGTSTCLVCRVSRQWHSANVQIFAECQYFSTRQSDCAADLCKLLCRVFCLKHSAKW